MKPIDFRLVLLGFGLIACGDSDGPTGGNNRVLPPPRVSSVAVVAGTVVGSAGQPVEGANVSVMSFLLPDTASRPRRGERCVGFNVDSTATTTNAMGQFHVLLQGDPKIVDACGLVVVRTNEERVDTISGIGIHYRDPPPETANLHMTVR